MATYNGRNLTPMRGINIKGSGDGGVIRFEIPDRAPATTTGERILYLNASGQLVYDDGASATVIGGAGNGSVPSWESIFSNDATFTITPDQAFTIAGNRATATAVLALSNVAGGSGAVISISNSGSGNDVTGTSATWSVTAAGVATFAGVSISGTSAAIATTGAAVWTLVDNNTAALSIGASGDTNMMVFDTSNAQPIVKFNDYLTVVDGNATFISTSNTVTNVLVTNNTATTYGVTAASAGIVVFRSTSLTTGTLLKLQLTEGTLNGGFYLECFDATAGSAVFTLGEDGAQVIAGAGGSTMFTVTAGDLVVSDGSLALTDADNAATFTVTNNTATSASVFVVAGSGVFTGSTTTSFLTITPSGLTSGTAVYLPVAGLTTGKALHVVGNALTSGNLVHVSSSATAIATTGRLLKIEHSGATGTSAVLSEFSSAANDETVILKVTASAALAAGVAFSVSAAALTTGSAISAADLDALTTGKGLHIASSATAITTTGRLLHVVHSGATGTSAVLSEFASAANDETVVLRVSASAALAAGVLLDLTGAAVTTGTLLDIGDADALTTGTGINLVSNSTSNGTRSLLNIKNDNTGATGTTPLTITQDAPTSTNYFKAIVLNGNTIWVGNGTTGQGNLSGTAGDILINGGSSKIEFCTGTTNWTATT